VRASEREVRSRPGRWLLIGNSRWHWAAPSANGLQCWSQTPQPLDRVCGDDLLAWAAVGPVPVRGGLDPGRRLTLDHVPLAAAPPWLGVDRALVAWQAWQDCGFPVLVADAGTALSLTRVDGRGRFAGGRILAGAALQWKALAAGTALLPGLEASAGPGSHGHHPEAAWPCETAAAMRVGVMAGLAAAIQAAWEDARRQEPRCRLRITGGDGVALAERLGLTPEPDLALRALARLRPAPGP
jgi:type III pantothenate kinase